MHVNNPTITTNESSYPLQVTYGAFRNWDVYQVSWPDIELCEAASGSPTDKCFHQDENQNLPSNFKPLTTELQDLYTAGVNNVMLTISRTPAWAVTTAQDGDSSCNYYGGSGSPYNGACYAPNGTGVGNDNHLATDGTGDDLIWRNWVTAVATWVTNSTDCPNCASVKYWSIWNEFDRNNPGTGSSPVGVSWYALVGNGNGLKPCSLTPCPTPDQLMRMTEDAQCIIEGTGYVDNYPNSGSQTPCASLGSGWTIGIIGSSARIVAPSISDGGTEGNDPPQALKCFFYCDQTACTNWYGSSCVNTNGWPHLPADVDIIDYHNYAPYGNPETRTSANVRAVLRTNELNKPLWVGEGSWMNTFQTGQVWTDPYAQGGFAARWLASVWAQTLPVSGGCSWEDAVCQQAFWYGYDYDDQMPTGGGTPQEISPLYCPGTLSQGTCANGGTKDMGVGLISPTAGMYNTAVGWLTGAVPNAQNTEANPFCNNDTSLGASVWHCDFAIGSYYYSMVWDNKDWMSEKGKTDYCPPDVGGNPYVCGTTSYPVPTGPINFVGGAWEDLNPVKTYYTGAYVNIGLNPILLIAPPQ